MENKTINIGVVEKVADALNDLRDKVAFVGGAVISLYTDDPAADELRPTKDIDLSITLESYGAWAALQEELARLGFSPDPTSHVYCRFTYEDVTVDIMPDDEKVLGFSNPWYKPGLQNLMKYSLPNGMEINLLPLPYFIATKFSAFHGRGESQHRTSHDFEDIIYLTDNCISIVQVITSTEGEVKDYLQGEYKQVWENENRTEIISCHLSPIIREERLKIIESKIQQILGV
ncbi:MAG: nucleotidyl transferase AbiEii/AbiGii toxin family protein [Cyclobacteriaceae bacterium]